jgi:uncharacterized protein (TIGR03067 family)
MQTCLFILPFLLLCATVFASDDANAKVSSESIQGVWLVESMQTSDFTVTGSVEKPMRFTFREDKLWRRPRFDLDTKISASLNFSALNYSKTSTFVFVDGGPSERFKIDETQSPVHLDVVESGKNKKDVKIHQSICRMNGEYLEICIGNHRPVEFKPTSNYVLLKLKRAEVRK